MIEVKNLSVSLGSFLMKDVTLDVQDGEYFVLLGPTGAGALMGASVAAIGIPVGLNNTFLHNLSLYGSTGLALDIIARLPRINIRNPLGALVCGASAHMVKFGFIIRAAYASPVTKHFMVIGITQAALLHLAFGAVAGIVGWGAYRIARPHTK